MNDISFEKDYRETESAEHDKWCDEVFDRAVNWLLPYHITLIL